jgi:hypothetical protein
MSGATYNTVGEVVTLIRDGGFLLRYLHLQSPRGCVQKVGLEPLALKWICEL